MIFELGKQYIVDVTRHGIIPSMEFNKDRWFDKDCDNLDFLTDEEKKVVINDVLNKIRDEILRKPYEGFKLGDFMDDYFKAMVSVLDIIDKYIDEVEITQKVSDKLPLSELKDKWKLSYEQLYQEKICELNKRKKELENKLNISVQNNIKNEMNMCCHTTTEDGDIVKGS